MSVKFIKNMSKEDHDLFVMNHPLCTLSQLSSWGDVKAEWEKQYVGLLQDDKIVACAQCFIRKLPLNLSMVYVARGPILDYDNQEVVTTFFRHLKQHFKTLGCIMIKFDPPIVLHQAPFNEFSNNSNQNHPVFDTLKKIDAVHRGFNKSMNAYAQPRYLVHLTKETYDKEGFSSQVKRNINRAVHKGVKIQRIDESEINRFAKIVTYTEKRKNIGLRNAEYFARMVKAFSSSSYVSMALLNQKELLNDVKKTIKELETRIQSLKVDSGPYKKNMDQFNAAIKEQERLQENIANDGDVVDVAGIFAISTPNSFDLLYMGLNDRYKKYLAPHLLYDDAIKWGFKQGVNVVDFGGISGTLDDGLSQFKAGFNADVVEMIGEFDIVQNSFLYHGYEYGWPKVKKIMLFIKRHQTHSF